VGFGDANNRDQFELGGVSPSVSTFIDFTEDMDAYAIEDGLRYVLLDSAARDGAGTYRFGYLLGFSNQIAVGESESNLRTK